MEHKTCEQRINKEYITTTGILYDLWEYAQENDPDDYHPKHETNLYEYGLSLDYVEPGTFQNQERGYFRYQLSYGGPSDEFRFFIDEVGNPYKIEYWFLDWWDGASRTLRNENETLLKEIFEFLTCEDALGIIERQKS